MVATVPGYSPGGVLSVLLPGWLKVEECEARTRKTSQGSIPPSVRLQSDQTHRQTQVTFAEGVAGSAGWKLLPVTRPVVGVAPSSPPLIPLQPALLSPQIGVATTALL